MGSTWWEYKKAAMMQRIVPPMEFAAFVQAIMMDNME